MGGIACVGGGGGGGLRALESGVRCHLRHHAASAAQANARSRCVLSGPVNQGSRGERHGARQAIIWGLSQGFPALGRSLLNFPPTRVAQHPGGSAGRRWCWAALVTAATQALTGRWRCPQAPCSRCMCRTCAGQCMFGGEFSRALPSAGQRWVRPQMQLAPRQRGTCITRRDEANSMAVSLRNAPPSQNLTFRRP